MAARIKIETKGKPPEQVAEELRAALAHAPVRAMKRIGTGAQTDYREQILAAGLGARLGRVIRADVYPNTGYDASVRIYPKPPGGAQIVSAFDRGALIRSKNGLYLAVPTKNAPKRGEGGGRISPSNWPVARYGPLRFVYRPNGWSLLVVDNVRPSFARASGELRGFRLRTPNSRAPEATVVMFILKPQVRLRKRLNVQGIRERWARLGPEIVVEEFEAEADKRRL